MMWCWAAAVQALLGIAGDASGDPSAGEKSPASLTTSEVFEVVRVPSVFAACARTVNVPPRCRASVPSSGKRVRSVPLPSAGKLPTR